MAFSAMLGITSFAEDAGVLVVSQASLEFADNVYLLIAVDYSAVSSADGITLKIKNNKTGDETTIDAPAADIEDVPAGCVAFKYDDIGAKNMGDELSIQAYLNGTASGDPITYSILEYALRAENLANEKLTALVKSMIKYGAEAQKAWSHEGTYDLSLDHSLVKLKGGATFADGTTKAIMKAGDSLTATKAGAASTDVWYNSRVQQRGTGSSLTVNYTEDNQTLFVLAAPSANIAGAQIDYEKMHKNVADGTWYENRNGVSGWWYKFEDGRIAQVKWETVNGSANWWTTDAEGNKIVFPGGFSGPDLKPIANPGQQFIVHKNQYVEFTSNDPDIYATASSGSAFRFNHTTDGPVPKAIAEIASDANAKAFTISFTFAAGDDTVNMFSYFSLRGSNQNKLDGAAAKVYLKAADGTVNTAKEACSGTGHISNQNYALSDGSRAIPWGRLTFIRADNTFIQNGIAPFLKENGTAYNSKETRPADTVFASSYCGDSDIHTPGEFITVHSVFVFETETEGMRIDYYVNDNPNVVASVNIDMMQKSDFTGGSWYIDSANNAAVQSFLKCFAVTPGNIADNFK